MKPEKIVINVRTAKPETSTTPLTTSPFAEQEQQLEARLIGRRIVSIQHCCGDIIGMGLDDGTQLRPRFNSDDAAWRIEAD